MAYRQIFAQQYPVESLGDRLLEDVIVYDPDGNLSVTLGDPPDYVELPSQQSLLSQLIMDGDHDEAEYISAHTADGRYNVEIEVFEHEAVQEYWLTHTDEATGKFKRAKLTSDWRPTLHNQPRVAVSPAGSFFVADDSGTMRLYTAAHFLDAGAFQVAHARTGNRVVALAISEDDQLIAGLSSWKDIVLYSVPERRVIFVRQIQDHSGWYDTNEAFILIAGNGETIVTAGIGDKISVNIFQQVSLKVT